ncbi:hypothetical protein M5E87_24410 [Flavonifractor plautii]|nr:hypothetical protein M5E87_24410 [Flavonifractor plautii]
MSFRSFSSFFALRRRLRAGKEPRRSGWRCSARINAACLALLYLGGPQLCRPGSRAWHALGGETATVNRPFPDFALEELEGRPRLEAAPSVWSVERRGWTWTTMSASTGLSWPRNSMRWNGTWRTETTRPVSGWIGTVSPSPP